MAIDFTRTHPSANGPSAQSGPAGGGVNLSKITLSKSAPTVSLAKRGESQGAMRVNLNWSQGAAAPAKKGLFSKLAAAAQASGAVDLDLGCLYELSNGQKGVIQALGNSFGALQAPPFIQLDGDDRSGAVTGGENMHINLAQPDMFRRILIFAMIYEGAPNWAAVDGVVTLSPTSGPQVEVKLDSANNSARICSIALIQNTPQGITVTREVEYVQGSQRDLDLKYGWGLQWQAGRK